jgi:predicted transcriptional regulator
MNKREFEEIQRKQFEVHTYIHDNPKCSITRVTKALNYNRTSTQTRIRELVSQHKLKHEPAQRTAGKSYTSICTPSQVVTFAVPIAKILPSMLLGSLWMPGHLELG